MDSDPLFIEDRDDPPIDMMSEFYRTQKDEWFDLIRGRRSTKGRIVILGSRVQPTHDPEDDAGDEPLEEDPHAGL